MNASAMTRRTPHSPAALSAVLALALLAVPAAARQREASFLRGVDRGSAWAYGPLVQVANEGFDILQWSSQDPRIDHLTFRVDARNVTSNLGDPFHAVRDYGASDFVTHELLPLGFTDETGQWIPNYTLHLVGGGIAHASLREWFDDRGVEHAWAWASGVFLAQSFLNEMMENGGRRGNNVDAVADVYVFNPAAVALFSNAHVRRFFANTLNASIWGLQPTLLLSDGTIRNAGQYVALKWRVPGTRVYLFQQMGLGSLTGVSVSFAGEYHATVAAGYRTWRATTVDEFRGLKAVESAPMAGFFLDYRHSLLASVLVADLPAERVRVNVYPGVLGHRWAPGFWAVAGDGGAASFGLTTRIGLGAGW